MKTELARLLGHDFRDPALLEAALTHRSATRNGAMRYERLEFLGDRVLSLVVADMLYDAFPDEDEGHLARRHVALVRREALAEVARAIGLGQYIRLSMGEEETSGRENPAILADVCEAVIGALFRDAGLDAARAFILRHWQARLEGEARPPQDAKTALQEWAQQRGRPLPLYRMVGRSGPDHAPAFIVSVEVEGAGSEQGQGPSKRVAEQAAAAGLMRRLNSDG